MTTLGQLAHRRYSPLTADIADAAMELINGQRWERLSSLLAHLGVDGGIERVLDRAIAQAICGASDTMLRNAAAYVYPWHYSETLNLDKVGLLIAAINSNGGGR